MEGAEGRAFTPAPARAFGPERRRRGGGGRAGTRGDGAHRTGHRGAGLQCGVLLGGVRAPATRRGRGLFPCRCVGLLAELAERRPPLPAPPRPAAADRWEVSPRRARGHRSPEVRPPGHLRHLRDRGAILREVHAAKLFVRLRLRGERRPMHEGPLRLLLAARDGRAFNADSRLRRSPVVGLRGQRFRRTDRIDVHDLQPLGPREPQGRTFPAAPGLARGVPVRDAPPPPRAGAAAPRLRPAGPARPLESRARGHAEADEKPFGGRGPHARLAVARPHPLGQHGGLLAPFGGHLRTSGRAGGVLDERALRPRGPQPPTRGLPLAPRGLRAPPEFRAVRIQFAGDLVRLLRDRLGHLGPVRRAAPPLPHHPRNRAPAGARRRREKRRPRGPRRRRRRRRRGGRLRDRLPRSRAQDGRQLRRADEREPHAVGPRDHRPRALPRARLPARRVRSAARAGFPGARLESTIQRDGEGAGEAADPHTDRVGLREPPLHMEAAPQESHGRARDARALDALHRRAEPPPRELRPPFLSFGGGVARTLRGRVALLRGELPGAAAHPH
mmetsp:Transcript_44617/g.129796  ORF Transcript_44617/g.129796 Transcript_44617/m.129796 type:complete len:558 (-) Transcript_44617:1290-2963(-)